MTDTRPVWLTREQRDWLTLVANSDPRANPLVATWDAAPADATEAVRETIAEWHRADTPEMRDVSQERAVLRALGMPDA